MEYFRNNKGKIWTQMSDSKICAIIQYIVVVVLFSH